MSRLMSDYSVTNLVIIRDDATIAEHQRAEFNTVTTSMGDTPKRPSFTNSGVNNIAPTLPSRKKSFDDISLSMKRKDGNRRKRGSLNEEFLSHGMKSTPMPSLDEGSSRETRNMLFGDIFRDVDELLKETA